MDDNEKLLEAARMLKSHCKNNSDYNPDEGIYGECGRCYEYSNFEPRNFCGECGRPLTDAAWEMLERRIARHEQQ